MKPKGKKVYDIAKHKRSKERCCITAWSLGTGQIHEAMRPMVDVCQTINCLHDAEWIFVTQKGINNADV